MSPVALNTKPSSFILPDLMSACHLEGSTSSHYALAAAESSAWINSYNIFSGKKLAFFLRGYNELLVAHAYPYADYEQFRTCCDFVNLLFVVDEVSDDQSGKDARATGYTFLNVMNDPSWDDGSVLAKITREFRERLMRSIGPNSARRFLIHCKDYVDAVATEAELRERGEVLDLEPFIHLRRENSAIRLCFGLFEYALGIDLPDEVFANEAFMDVYWAAADAVCWANDVYSYNMEQAKGLGGNNIVTVLMHTKGVDLQTSSDLVGEHFDQLMARWKEAQTRIPSWGPSLDADVAKYVYATGCWIKGNIDWSFKTQRYFGAEYERVKKDRVIVLNPRVDC